MYLEWPKSLHLRPPRANSFLGPPPSVPALSPAYGPPAQPLSPVEVLALVQHLLHLQDQGTIDHVCSPVQCANCTRHCQTSRGEQSRRDRMRWASLGCVRSTVACAPVRSLVATLLPGYFPWRWDDVEFELGWISEELADAVQKLGRALFEV
jgi:hypothetical protein